MKKISKFIFNLLLGLMFINAGLNKLFNYIPVPEDLPERLTMMNTAMEEIGWLLPLTAAAEIIGGALFISRRFRALGAVILFPVMMGILIIHVTVAPSGLPVVFGLFAILVWTIIENRKKYLQLIQ